MGAYAFNDDKSKLDISNLGKSVSLANTINGNFLISPNDFASSDLAIIVLYFNGNSKRNVQVVPMVILKNVGNIIQMFKTFKSAQNYNYLLEINIEVKSNGLSTTTIAYPLDGGPANPQISTIFGYVSALRTTIPE